MHVFCVQISNIYMGVLNCAVPGTQSPLYIVYDTAMHQDYQRSVQSCQNWSCVILFRRKRNYHESNCSEHSVQVSIIYITDCQGGQTEEQCNDQAMKQLDQTMYYVGMSQPGSQHQYLMYLLKKIILAAMQITN